MAALNGGRDAEEGAGKVVARPRRSPGPSRCGAARLPGRSPPDAARCRVLPAGGGTVVEWALTLGPGRNIRRADGVGRAVTHAQEGTR